MALHAFMHRIKRRLKRGASPRNLSEAAIQDKMHTEEKKRRMDAALAENTPPRLKSKTQRKKRK